LYAPGEECPRHSESVVSQWLNCFLDQHAIRRMHNDVLTCQVDIAGNPSVVQQLLQFYTCLTLQTAAVRGHALDLLIKQKTWRLLPRWRLFAGSSVAQREQVEFGKGIAV